MSALVDRHDLKFLLNDWLSIDQLFQYERFADHSADTVEAMLDAAERIGLDLLAPALRVGDDNEPQLTSESRVIVHEATKRAVLGIRDSGLFGAVFDQQRGGLQLPFTVYLAAMGILHSANSAATFYMVLTVGNARLIATAGTSGLVEHFADPQIAGNSFGTMCLSESQAGSSLGDITTRAIPEATDELGDRYRLSGAKMWISGADHDVVDQIVHLVLAKIPNEDGSLPAGSRGISLFIVPKMLQGGEQNDIVVASLNHKLGSRCYPNAAVNLGEGFARPDGAPGAIGWRLGEPGQGLALMFQMMNEARLSVGMSAAMMAYRGYLLSLDYAQGRLQGRASGQNGGPQVPIIEHVDVRRMLLQQKAAAEGGLALTLYVAREQDLETVATSDEAREAASAIVGLMTPLAKSWPSEFGQKSLDVAIQVLGGAGFTRDFEAELLYRDNRISPIYEGTTGIQAIDLVSRKLRRDGGRAYRLLRQRVDRSLDRSAITPTLEAAGQAIGASWSAIDAAVDRLIGAPDHDAAIAHATAFLNALGHGVVAWLLLDITALAASKLDVADGAVARDYLSGKVKLCQFFAETECPLIGAWLSPLLAGGSVASGMRVAEFSQA